MANTRILQKRKFFRVNINEEIILALGEYVFNGCLVDLSLKGVLLEFGFPIKVDIGKNYDIKIFFNNNNMLDMSGISIYSNRNKNAFEIKGLNSKSFSGLLKILQEKSGNSELIEDDLRQLAKDTKQVCF